MEHGMVRKNQKFNLTCFRYATSQKEIPMISTQQSVTFDLTLCNLYRSALDSLIEKRWYPNQQIIYYWSITETA